MLDIAIVGGGNMGEALIKGLHKSHRVSVSEGNAARVKYLKSKYRVTAASAPDILAQSRVIIFAVKPQDMEAVLGNVGPAGERLFISIAAGLRTTYFEKHLDGKPKVVRAMPNMPALIGEGVTGLCRGKYASPADLATAQKLLSALGKTLVVKESMMDALTAVSGSGPAYVFLFVEAWMAAAKTLCFNNAEARLLVYQTLTGSAHILEKAGLDARTLRAKVTSKGGTTQAALEVLTKGKFDRLINQALLAAQKRAGQLAK